jgi:hypothetical protein
MGRNKTNQTEPVVTATESAEVAATVTDGTEITETLTDNATKTFAIETVSVPKRSGRKASLEFPLAQLTPGSDQSFKVPATDDKVKAVTASVRAYAYRNGFNVTLRPEAGGIRVWRSVGKVKGN